MLKTALLLAAGIILSPVVLPAQEPFEVVELDSATVDSMAESWYEQAETGQKTMGELDFYLVVSPDQRWMVMGRPVEGLDVVTYKLYLISIYDANLRLISEQALGVTFSPTSDYLFVVQGPNPLLYDLERHAGVVIKNISSGLENYPCWVSNWSRDGKELIVRQQLRFDDAGQPRAWRLTITNQ